MAKTKNKFYSNQRDNFLFLKTVDLIASGVVEPSSLSNEYIRRILSNKELLKKKSYRCHTIGYMFAITQSEEIQRRILEDNDLRGFKVTTDGKSMAHIIAANPASDRIKSIILSEKKLDLIKDDNGNTVSSMLVIYPHYEHEITDMLRTELND